ncbi:hypothetical protein [Legionella tunisiensis]|uniref:hypothetical protein n=1 Tax=Legionella tunisiensis TaxID=1034944 RepID=UPI00030D4804|nr:hypothetical protein [Legionella tunisiensis]
MLRPREIRFDNFVSRNTKAAIHFLDKVFGAMVGVTLFSLTALVLNLLMALALFALTLGARVVLPVAAAFWAFKVTHSVSLTLFSTLMVLGLDRLILPPLLLIGSAQLVLKAVRDFTYTVPYGLTEGYNKGLIHVISQWWKIPFSFFSYLRAEDEDIAAFGQDFFDLSSISSASIRTSSSGARMRSLLRTGDGEFPGIEEALRRSFNHSQPVAKSTLTKDEFEQFDLGAPAASKTPFEPLSEQELLDAASKPALQKVLDQYNDLYKTLRSYDEDPVNFDDQQFILPITTPIVLVKQVRTAEKPNETWKTLPAYIWLTGKESLQTWMAKNTELPSNRDKLNGTDYIDGQPTRYRYYSYQAGSKNSPELHEMAATIRSGLKEPVPVQTTTTEAPRGFLTALSGFFGRATGQGSAPVIKPNVSGVSSITL